MITQNMANHRYTEHFRIDDIHESAIRPNKLNSTPLEVQLVRVNVGNKRRLRNNHAARLARFKAN